VGTGARARLYYEALALTYRETCELAALCDLSPTRMDYANRILTEVYGAPAAPVYYYTEFDKMIDEIKPDCVIVTSVDRTHHHYIIRAMERGCDVITEKPMTIDAAKAQAILDCQKRTGRKLRVTFNYRYAPHNSKMRELIMDGTIGQVFSVHFEWLLNTLHGADYFRRWHRNKNNSGGLLVHKSTHHFDLVNFWLGTSPSTVFAYGGLNFYGMMNAEARGETKFYYRSYGSEAAKGDPFALDMESGDAMRELYLEAENDSGYIRDRSVFSDDISIEDTLGVIVRYKSGAILTYSLNAYMPWEGFNVSINGSKGRLELKVVEASYVNAGGELADEGAALSTSLTVLPMFGEPWQAEIEEKSGGHGGGDKVMLNDIFGEPEHDPLGRAASHVDGAMSILTGIAANTSIASGREIKIDDLLRY